MTVSWILFGGLLIFLCIVFFDTILPALSFRAKQRKYLGHIVRIHPEYEDKSVAGKTGKVIAVHEYDWPQVYVRVMRTYSKHSLYGACEQESQERLNHEYLTVLGKEAQRAGIQLKKGTHMPRIVRFALWALVVYAVAKVVFNMEAITVGVIRLLGGTL